MRRILAFLALMALPFTAQAFTASDVEFVEDAILVHDIETVDDLINAVPDFVTVDETDFVSESTDAMIAVELRVGDDVVEGVIDPETATLTLYAGPDAQGCTLQYTGGWTCINHILYQYYCWTGSWTCIFYEPRCFWMQMQASCG